MTQTDVLDRKALASASRYMGEVAWLTIILGLVFGAGYVATVAMALTGTLSLFVAVPLVALLTYLNYTILHESVHGSISGNRRSLRWVNKAMGYVAAWILMIPLTAHRHEHTAHHRHTNDGAADPDFHIGRMRNSLPAAVWATIRTALAQFSFYSKNRWQNATTKQNLVLCLEVGAALAPRLAILAAGYWVEFLALFVFAWLIGATVLMYLFAFIVHRPHEKLGRYEDTSTILLPRPLHTLVTWLCLFQNYHSIHHRFPRVPFYRYAALYEEIQDVMEAKGAPVYRITLRGLEPFSPTLAS